MIRPVPKSILTLNCRWNTLTFFPLIHNGYFVCRIVISLTVRAPPGFISKCLLRRQVSEPYIRTGTAHLSLRGRGGLQGTAASLNVRPPSAFIARLRQNSWPLVQPAHSCPWCMCPVLSGVLFPVNICRATLKHYLGVHLQTGLRNFRITFLNHIFTSKS